MRRKWLKMTVIVLGLAMLVGLACIGRSWHKEYKERQFAEKWERVKVGMAREEVNALLGKPALDWDWGEDEGLVWYYGERKDELRYGIGLYCVQRFPYVKWSRARTYDFEVRFGHGETVKSKRTREEAEGGTSG